MKLSEIKIAFQNELSDLYSTSEIEELFSIFCEHFLELNKVELRQNLDRDLSDEVSKFLSGFKMIYTNLVSILEDFEVKEIDCKGLEFDPNKMEAVLTDSDKNLPSNVVIEVLQKGYTYKDKVIRVAMVKVNE